jgi:hypothetical protein
MATLIITEFGESMRAHAVGGGEMGNLSSVLATQRVTISGTSAQATLNAATRFVRLVTDTACSVVASSNPTAVLATHMPLRANVEEYFGVNKGDKLAAITA